MSSIIPILISAGISAIFTSIGVYVTISNRISVIETKIDTLSDRVEKHNNIIERTYVLETKVDRLERDVNLNDK